MLNVFRSEPSSSNYAKHWTPAQVNAAFSPHDDTVQAVKEWLISAGIAAERLAQSTNKGWVSFHATAKEAENLLHAELYEHEHVSNGRWAVGCDEYHVPKRIQKVWSCASHIRSLPLISP